MVSLCNLLYGENAERREDVKMDAKEAYKYLDELYQDQSEGYSIDLAHGGQGNDEMEKWLESMRLALEAFEKQIPEKPKCVHEGFYCLGCGTRLRGMLQHCEDCGQKLAWSELDKWTNA